jgi:hypothetical protein
MFHEILLYVFVIGYIISPQDLVAVRSVCKLFRQIANQVVTRIKDPNKGKRRRIFKLEHASHLLLTNIKRIDGVIETSFDNIIQLLPRYHKARYLPNIQQPYPVSKILELVEVVISLLDRHGSDNVDIKIDGVMEFRYGFEMFHKIGDAILRVTDIFFPLDHMKKLCKYAKYISSDNTMSVRWKQTVNTLNDGYIESMFLAYRPHRKHDSSKFMLLPGIFPNHEYLLVKTWKRFEKLFEKYEFFRERGLGSVVRLASGIHLTSEDLGERSGLVDKELNPDVFSDYDTDGKLRCDKEFKIIFADSGNYRMTNRYLNSSNEEYEKYHYHNHIFILSSLENTVKRLETCICIGEHLMVDIANIERLENLEIS